MSLFRGSDENGGLGSSSSSDDEIELRSNVSPSQLEMQSGRERGGSVLSRVSIREPIHSIEADVEETEDFVFIRTLDDLDDDNVDEWAANYLVQSSTLRLRNRGSQLGGGGRLRSSSVRSSGSSHGYVIEEDDSNNTNTVTSKSKPVSQQKKEGTAQLMSHYDQFDTIDWIRDGIISRRQRYAVDWMCKRDDAKWYHKLYLQFYRVQGWLLITLIGAIDICVDWMIDVRLGICTTNPFLSRKLCCEVENAGGDDTEACDEWNNWNDVVGIHGQKSEWFWNYFVYTSFCVVFAVIAAWFVRSMARWAAGSGIPETKTILGGFVIHGFNSWRTLFVKVTGLVFSVSSGLNLGKEGPLVHVASCICNIASRIFPKYRQNQAKKREMLSAAAACGVSVAFGAPIGGVLFSLEEVSYYFPHKTMWRSFLCAILAALVLQLMNPFHDGKLVIFQTNFTHSWLWFELIPFMLIGALGGVLGAIFIKLNVHVCELRKHSSLHRWPVTEVAVVALFTSLISFTNDYLRGNASETLNTLFSECPAGDPSPSELCDLDNAWQTVATLVLAATARLLLTVFTFGLKVPAGLFIPSMGVGAALGRAIGIVIELWQQAYPDFFLFNGCLHQSQCISPGVYALIGAAAMLGGVTRMSVSLTVIMFELTGDVDYILPIMLTIMTSKWVGDALGHDGIYDEHILMQEYPFLDNKMEYRFKARAGDVMKSIDLGVLTLHHNTVGKLESIVASTAYTGFPVVTNTKKMQVVGYIARSELHSALRKAREHCDVSDDTHCYFAKDLPADLPQLFIDLRPWMDTTPIQVNPRTPLNIIFDMFAKLGLRYVLVSHHGRLVGIMTKKDILQHIAISFNKSFRTFTVPQHM